MILNLITRQPPPPPFPLVSALPLLCAPLSLVSAPPTPRLFPLLTSMQVGVRLVGGKEEGLPRLQVEEVEEKDTEAADVPWKLRVETEQE